MAADWRTAERIGRAVADSELITAVGYHWRYLDTVETARELSRRHAPRLVLGRWLDFTPPAPWWIVAAQSGGQLVEQATHLFDLARVLVGEVETVYATGSRTARTSFPDCDIDDVSTASLVFRCGAVGAISSSCLLHWPHRIGLELVAEGLALELTERELVTHRAGGKTTTQPASVDPFVQEDRDFIDAVQGRANRIRVPYAEALATHRLVTTAAESALRGRPIQLVGEGAAHG